MKKKSLITAAILIIAGVIGLLGCSSGKSGSAAFQVAFVSLSINEKAVSDYGTYLTGQIPDLTINGKAPLFTPMITGEARNDFDSGITVDPMMAMGSMMRMAAVGAAGDLDVIIADMENAARQARGGMFLPLTSILTSSELSALENRSLSFDILDTSGYEPRPTGEKTPACGVLITGNERIRNIFGNQEIGVFISANTKNLELAKMVVRSLL